MQKKHLIYLPFSLCIFTQCSTRAQQPLQPAVVTDTVNFDTDDPAIWINTADPAKSLVIGTDKDSNGGLYLFDLNGKIVAKTPVLKRSNNVDIAYGLLTGENSTDIAVATERETNSIRVFSLPGLKEMDNGGIPVFADEAERAPMGIALYTRPSDKKIFAIVGRKSGPADGYLFQYELLGSEKGIVTARLVRKFGKYSGLKEIESIAVDNESGFVYYSDEGFAVHKYYADPEKGNAELATFGKGDFKADLEGISIYKTGPKTGYILVSDQQAHAFNVYPREGDKGDPNRHTLIARIPVAATESDGSDVTNVNLGPKFPKGLFAAMSDDKTFHFYDWRQLEARIMAAKAKK
ncbi:MAG: phytase [Mucilaginibacter polytrichastri]|nr:phytase [Mucilaginibacter polytrichastri]